MRRKAMAEKKTINTTNLILLVLLLIINTVALIFIFDEKSKERVKTGWGNIRNWFSDKSGKLKNKFKKKGQDSKT